MVRLEERPQVKGEDLASVLPFDFPKGLARNPAAPSKAEDLFVLQEANNHGERGFSDCLFPRRPRN